MSYKQIFYTSMLFVGLTLTSCNKAANPSVYQTDTTEIDATFPVDEEIIDLIEPYKTQLDGAMNEVIGVFAHHMYKGDLPEGELGNFMSDAPKEVIEQKYQEFLPIDFSMMNFGGIRVQELPAGDVAMEDMYELMPFENELVIVELAGTKMDSLLLRISQKGGIPISKNVNLVIENGNPRDFLVNAEPYDPNKTYRVLLTDYVANGGDGMDMLEDVPQSKTNLKLRDVLIEYMQLKSDRQETVTARINGRIIVIN